MVSETPSADELLAAARTDEQRGFATSAVAFLSGQVAQRTPQDAAWGVGDEGRTLFHETSDEQERAEADAARQWQKVRWQAGFGWITGPGEFGGGGLSAGEQGRHPRRAAAIVTPHQGPARHGHR